MNQLTQCPICLSRAIKNLETHEGKLNDTVRLSCFRCGNFETTMTGLLQPSALTNEERAFLSHRIRWNQIYRTHDETYRRNEIQNILQGYVDFSPVDKQIKLLSFLSKYKKSGEYADVSKDKLLSVAAVAVPDNIGWEEYLWLCEDLNRRNIIQPEATQPNQFYLSTEYENSPLYRIRLTLDGWHYLEEQTKIGIGSKIGFMAMMFPRDDNPLSLQINEMFNCVRIEASDRGITIDNPLLSAPKNGLIDARLELEIKNARFLVADLTGGNQGAYWEAGLAHGLGKPVFYLCNDDPKQNLHFDTNHHLTIRWNQDNMGVKARELLEIIRNALPDLQLA